MHDIVIRIGADFLATFKVVDDTGTAVNLTGATITANMARALGQQNIATFTCTVLDAAAGTFKVELAANLTTPLTPGPAVWDVLIDQGGIELPWSEDAVVGNVLIKRGVTS